MKKDPRVQRTREQLHQALLVLIAEKGYDAVTVQDVLDRAEVARSSFYAHFRDKEDLLFAGFADVSASESENLFVSARPDHADYPDLGFPLFRHVQQYRQVAGILLGSPSGSPVVEHLRNVLVVQVREWLSLPGSLKPGAVPTDLVVHYLVNALLGMVIWWVNHDFPYSAENMGTAYKRLAMTGLAQAD